MTVQPVSAEPILQLRYHKSIDSSSQYQFVDSVTGHIYTIPDHAAGHSTLNYLLQ